MPSYREKKGGGIVQVGSPEDTDDSTSSYTPPSKVSTADLGAAAGEKGGGFTPPKMQPGESLGAFAARSKKAKEDYERTKGSQLKALREIK